MDRAKNMEKIKTSEYCVQRPMACMVKVGRRLCRVGKCCQAEPHLVRDLYGLHVQAKHHCCPLDITVETFPGTALMSRRHKDWGCLRRRLVIAVDGDGDGEVPHRNY